MAKLTDRTSVNPMPEWKSDEELAEIFKHLFRKNQKKLELIWIIWRIWTLNGGNSIWVKQLCCIIRVWCKESDVKIWNQKLWIWYNTNTYCEKLFGYIYTCIDTHIKFIITLQITLHYTCSLEQACIFKNDLLFFMFFPVLSLNF